MDKMNKRELLAYMQSLSTVIGQSLNAEGISGQLVRAKQGPLTLTYQVHLLNAKHMQIQRAKQLGEVMESYAGIGPVRVVTSLGQLIVEFPSPVICTPHASLLAANSRGANLAVGFDHWGEPVHLDLSRYPNLLVVGPPRTGKTSTMRSLVYSALRMSNVQNIQVETVVCAEKKIFWSAFENARGFGGFLIEKKEVLGYLEDLATEVVHKAKRSERFNPVQLVVIDDLMSLRSSNTGIDDCLAALVSIGGSLGVYVLVGTQSAGSRAGTGGIAVEDSIQARVIFKATSNQSAARSTGEGSEGLAELTNQQGDALLVVGTQKIRIATGYVEDEDVQVDLPKRDHPLKIMQQIQHRGVDLIHVDLPALPKIKPARSLTQEESEQVLDYLDIAQETGQQYSQRKVLLALFDGKNSILVGHLKQALGERYNEFFPSKDLLTV